MNVQQLFLVAAVLVSLSLVASQGDEPPKVEGSYIASGEMVETLEDESHLLTQVAFEESYDENELKAAFRVFVMGKNVTYNEDLNTGQTYRYDVEQGCLKVTVQDWIETKSPPSLMSYEDTNGTVRFSLKQLLSLSGKHLVERNLPATFRGIAARKWMYEMKEDPQLDTRAKLSVYAFWSEDSWTTSSSDTVPLGYVITKFFWENGKMKIHEQKINVFGFIRNAVDQALFEPLQGVICPDRKQTLPFPDVTNLQTIAIHSEFVLPDYLEAKYVEMWFDSRNKMLRMDMERIKDEDVPSEVPDKSRKYQSEVVVGNLGVVYRFTYQKGYVTCKVVPFDKFEFDVQNIFNFKLPLKDWKVAKAFGLNETTYTYVGTTTKRDIPCHLFQGVRTDWPEPAAGVKSLWEWCFSINMTKSNNVVLFRNSEYGLVNAYVKILNSSKPADFPPDFRMIHHFYHVTQKDTAELSIRYFDIERCFDENVKRALQFQVNWTVTEDSMDEVVNATGDFVFLQKWKSVIYKFSGLAPDSLQVSQVSAEVSDNRLYLKFTLLPPHQDLPEDLKKNQKSAFEAENAFRDNANIEKVFITYNSGGTKSVKLWAVRHSLEFQVNHTFMPHESLSTTEKPTSAHTRFTLLTDPDVTSQSTASVSDGWTTNKVTDISGSTATSSGDDSSTTTTGSPPPKPDLRDRSLRHAGGTVAAVALSMLLVGLSVGSAGVFVKYNGLPACIKCGQ